MCEAASIDTFVVSVGSSLELKPSTSMGDVSCILYSNYSIEYTMTTIHWGVPCLIMAVDANDYSWSKAVKFPLGTIDGLTFPKIF